MKNVTIVFPVTSKVVYMAVKKLRGGTGYFNGFGGHVEDKESIVNCAVREFYEESGATVQAKDLQKRGKIDVYEEKDPLCQLHVFVTYIWQGNFRETEEMGLARSFYHHNLPIDRMWPADSLWLPIVLKGLSINQGTIVYVQGKKRALAFKCESYRVLS